MKDLLRKKTSSSSDSASHAPEAVHEKSNDASKAAQHEEHVEKNYEMTAKPSRLQPPPAIAVMTAEHRQAVEKKLVRKMDLRIMPMIIIMYIMNYLDRNNIASAKVQDIDVDLGLEPNQYQTAVSILFVGYILMQIPSNLFLNKIGRPALYLPTAMIVWGAVSASTAGVQNYSGLIAVRFFLGFVEAPYFPGCLYFLSCWYTRKELGFRTAVLYSGSLISGAFSGLIAAGIQSGLDGSLGLESWRWLFIIEGTITVGIAFIAYFILPNFPRTTKWLTEEERALAIWRLEEDIGEDDWQGVQQQSLWSGFKLAFWDIKTWILMLLVSAQVGAISVTNFFPSVVESLNYSTVDTLLLTVPPYVLAVICTYICAAHADKTGERTFHIIIPTSIGIIAFIIAATTTYSGVGPQYLAIMLIPPGIYCGYVVALAWISNSMPRPPAKRAAALAAVNAVSNSTQIYTAFMYKDAFAPRYTIAFSVNACCGLLTIVATVWLRIVLQRLNKKLDRGEYVEGAINDNAGSIPGEAAKKGFRFRV